MTVHIIIPTCGQPGLKKLLPVLANAGHRYLAHLMVNSGNAEWRRNADELREEANQRPCCRMRQYVYPKQHGFGKAVNEAFRIISPGMSDIIVLLNDDVGFVEGGKNWLKTLVRAVEKQGGQVGPSVHHVGRNGTWGNGTEKYRYCEGWCFAMTGQAVYDAYMADCRRIQKIEFWPVFDPAFDPYLCEDMDLSIRVQEAGLPITQVDLPLVHRRGETIRGAREPHWTKNRNLLIRKWNLNG